MSKIENPIFTEWLEYMGTLGCDELASLKTCDMIEAGFYAGWKAANKDEAEIIYLRNLIERMSDYDNNEAWKEYLLYKEKLEKK